jgi:hypothetical protein
MLSEPKTLTMETPEQRELRRLQQELEYVNRQRDNLSLNRSIAFLRRGKRFLDRITAWSNRPSPGPGGIGFRHLAERSLGYQAGFSLCSNGMPRQRTA